MLFTITYFLYIHSLQVEGLALRVQNFYQLTYNILCMNFFYSQISSSLLDYW